MNKKTKLLVLSGLFLALNIILTRIVKPIDLPYVKLTFGFIANSFGAIILGPVLGGIVSALADILGFSLFPSGIFFPGFTISAFLGAFIYGIILKKNPGSIYRIIAAVLVVTVVVDLILNTVWLTILLNKAWTAFVTFRVVKSLLFMPVQVVIIKLLWKSVGKEIQKLV